MLPTSQNKDPMPKCTFYNPIFCVFYEKEKLPLFIKTFCITFVCFLIVFWLCVMQEDLTPLIDNWLTSLFHEFPGIHILTKSFLLTYTICESKCTSLLWQNNKQFLNVVYFLYIKRMDFPCNLISNNYSWTNWCLVIHSLRLQGLTHKHHFFFPNFP